MLFNIVVDYGTKDLVAQIPRTNASFRRVDDFNMFNYVDSGVLRLCKPYSTQRAMHLRNECGVLIRSLSQ